MVGALLSSPDLIIISIMIVLAPTLLSSFNLCGQAVDSLVVSFVKQDYRYTTSTMMYICA